MASKIQKTVLVWLEWAIFPFQLNEESFAYLKRVAPRGVRLVRVKTEEEFKSALPEADTVLTWFFKREWYQLAPRMKILATPSAGRELIAWRDAPKGVKVSFGAYHGKIIAETVLALMLAHCRGLYTAHEWQLSGKGPLWRRAELGPYCFSLAGSRAVILGYGSIGHVIGEKLNALGVKFVGIRRRNIDRLDRELAKADWLIMALPSDTGTDKMIDARRLSLLHDGAAIVNIGRGNSIDESALAKELKAKRLVALLDVFAKEPLQESSPLAKNLPGLYRLPHASAFAPEYLPYFFDELLARGLL